MSDCLATESFPDGVAISGADAHQKFNVERSSVACLASTTFAALFGISAISA